MTKLYIFWSPAYPLRCKIGIARNVPRRRRQVSRSISIKLNKYVKVYRVVAVPIVATRSFEKLFHALFWFAHAPIRDTDGGTEWFRWIMPIAVVGVLGVFIVQFTLIGFLVWMLIQ